MTGGQDPIECDPWRIDDDDESSNGSREPTIGDVIVARYSRRQALKGLSAIAAVSVIGSVVGSCGRRPDHAWISPNCRGA